ncbi:hypothetical protein, partial [Rhizomonospora bruguierae]|uniref:hypothetical protein n=1 Tax=Rhizomonospora bruguierae TaxID=1581705 RepID=UPI001BCB4D27
PVNVRTGSRAGLARRRNTHRPLYARVLNLRHLRPGGLLCFLYFEGSLAVGILLALVEVIPWWGILVLPAIVAAMVKINDLIAGPLAGTAPATGRGRQAPASRQMTAVGRAVVAGSPPAPLTPAAPGAPVAAAVSAVSAVSAEEAAGPGTPAGLAQARAATTAARYDSPPSGQRYGNSTASSATRFGGPHGHETADTGRWRTSRENWPIGDTWAGARGAARDDAPGTGPADDRGADRHGWMERDTWPAGHHRTDAPDSELRGSEARGSGGDAHALDAALRPAEAHRVEELRQPGAPRGEAPPWPQFAEPADASGGAHRWQHPTTDHDPTDAWHVPGAAGVDREATGEWQTAMPDPSGDRYAPDAWPPAEPPAADAWPAAQPPAGDVWPAAQPPAADAWPAAQPPAGEAGHGAQPAAAQPPDAWHGAQPAATEPPAADAWPAAQPSAAEPPAAGAWPAAQPAAAQPPPAADAGHAAETAASPGHAWPPPAEPTYSAPDHAVPPSHAVPSYPALSHAVPSEPRADEDEWTADAVPPAPVGYTTAEPAPEPAAPAPEPGPEENLRQFAASVRAAVEGHTASPIVARRLPGIDAHGRRPGAATSAGDAHGRRPGAATSAGDAHGRRPGATGAAGDAHRRRPGAVANASEPTGRRTAATGRHGQPGKNGSTHRYPKG